MPHLQVSPLDVITKTVSAYYHVPVDVLKGRRRHQHIALARMVAMYLMRRMTRSTLETVGEFFLRDHTTVISNVGRVDHLMELDPLLKAQIEHLAASVCEKMPAAVPKSEQARQTAALALLELDEAPRPAAAAVAVRAGTGGA